MVLESGGLAFFVQIVLFKSMFKDMHHSLKWECRSVAVLLNLDWHLISE